MRTLFVIAVVLSSEGGQPVHAQISLGIRENDLSRRIEGALDETVTVRYVEAPLWQIVRDIRSGFGINVILDERALEDVALDLDSHISLEMSGVTLESMHMRSRTDWQSVREKNEFAQMILALPQEGRDYQ